jgi:PAS domain S-box-containing protein
MVLACAGFVRGAGAIESDGPGLGGEIVPFKLQLKWKHQFQFAGYYWALDRGYYKAAGLDVSFLEPTGGGSVVDLVMQGKADAGIADAGLVLYRAQGVPVKVLAAILQHSPVGLVVREGAGISLLSDLRGKKLGLEENDTEVRALLKSAGVSLSEVRQMPHSFSPDQIMRGELDGISAYVTDELFLLRQAGFPFKLFTARSVGVDFYGDVLFTSEAVLNRRPGDVRRFVGASMRGWREAMEQPEAAVELILSKYSKRHSRAHLLYEADEMRNLMGKEVASAGRMELERWRQIMQTHLALGLIPKAFPVEEMIWHGADVKGHWGFVMLWVAGGVGLGGGAWFLWLRAKREKKAREEAEIRLHDVHSRYRAMAETLQDVVWETDLDLRFLYVSPACVGLWGVDAERLKGQPIDARITATSSERLHQLIGKGLGHGGESVELTLIHASQREISVEAIVQAVELEGVLVGYRGLCRDISERKKSEETLHILSQAVEQSRDAIALTDLTGKILYVNQGFVESSGYSREELIGQNPRVLKSGQHSTSFYQEMWNTIGRGDVWEGELCNKNKRGELYWDHVRILPVRDESGAVVRFMAVRNNITRLKKATEALAASESRMRAVFENSTAGICIMDPSGRVQQANARWLEMFAYSGEQAREVCLQQILGGARAEEWLGAIVEGRLPACEGEGALYRRDGSQFWGNPALRPIRDSDGGIEAVLLLVVDLTAQHEAQHELEVRLRYEIAAATFSEILLSDHNAPDVLARALEPLRLACLADRAYLFTMDDLPDVGPCWRLLHESRGPGVESRAGNPALQRVACRDLPYWDQEQRGGHPIVGPVKGLPLNERSALEALGVRSVVAIPLFWDGVYSGFIGFDDCASERKWGETEVRLLRGAAGRLGDFMANRRAEQALREREARLRVLFDQNPISLWEEDWSGVRDIVEELRSEGCHDFRERLRSDPALVRQCLAKRRVVRVNRASLTLYEARDVSDLLEHLDVLVGEDTLAVRMEQIAALAEGCLEFTAEEPTRTLRKHPLWVAFWLRVVPGYEKNWGRVLVSIVDITDRRRAEAALREEETRYRLLADNSSDVIWTCDLDAILTYVSPALYHLLSFMPEEVIGQSLEQMISPSSLDLMKKELAELIAAASRGDRTARSVMEVEQPRKDGGAVWTEVIVQPMFDDEGVAAGLLGMSRDISERKKAQDRLHTMMEEMGTMNRLMTGREERVLELKMEINDLLVRSGQSPRYHELAI